MINDYRFFQEFFDGQIVKEESDRYKLFKIMLISCFSAAGLFMVFAGFWGYNRKKVVKLYDSTKHKLNIGNETFLKTW